MNTRTAFFVIFLMLISFIVARCNDPYYHQSEIDIPDNSWHMDKAATFKAEITDTLNIYSIKFKIGHQSDYRYSNLWLFIRTISPEKYAHIDTLEVFMAETDGKWIGNKNGSNYFIDFIYKKQVKFPKAGVYQFEIIQGMRDTELKGIGTIGFEIFGSR